MRVDIEALSGGVGEQERELAIRHILADYAQYDLRAFILPGSRKDCWDSCAFLLTRLPEDVFISILPDALEWLQDCNWPGASRIIDRSRQLPAHIRLPICAQAYRRASAEKDSEWMFNLASVFGYTIDQLTTGGAAEEADPTAITPHQRNPCAPDRGRSCV